MEKPADTWATFPAPIYKETVLAPLFEGAKAHFVRQLRRIDRAHCVMLTETGILSQDEGGAIAAALRDIEAELDVNALSYTGEVEDLFFLIEAELRRRLGPDLAGRLHTGRSRNDIDHTIYRMALKERIDELVDRGTTLADAMINKATVERDTIIVAYTHGQPAQPTTFGHYLSAAIEVLLRDLERLQAARAVVDHCPMGAAAITTSGFPLDRHRMAALLGFAAPAQNSYGAIATVDYVTATYAAVKLIFLHLGRLFQDFAAWTAFEVGQLHIPDGFVQVSSIMPQKRNPVAVEHLRLLASLAAGRADAVVGVMHNTPFTDMNDSEGEVQASGYAAFETGGRVFELLTGLVPALSVDAARVAANIEASCITVTELADGMARREGLSFRVAHEIAAAVSRAVIEAGGGLANGYDAFVAAFEAHAGRATSIDEADFAELVSAEHFVSVRDRYGGPAPAALDAALEAYRGTLATHSAEADHAAKRESAAESALIAVFDRLAAAA